MNDMQEWFYYGPYTINNRPIILKPGSTAFNLEKEFPTNIPLWVKFPNLPMSCWNRDSLSRIASAVGKPIYADECTANQTKISFARMLIEVNITNPVSAEITIKEPNGKQTQQAIDYDWKPKYCLKCSVVGHCCTTKTQGQMNAETKKQQPKKLVQDWRSKGPIKKNVEEVQVSTVRAETGNTPQVQHVMKTPEKTAQVVTARGSPELSLNDFPILISILVKNAFGKLTSQTWERCELGKLPPEMEGRSRTI